MKTREQIMEALKAKALEVNAFYEKYPNDADVPHDEATRLNSELAALGEEAQRFVKAAELRKASRALVAEHGGDGLSTTASVPAGEKSRVVREAEAIAAAAVKSFGSQFTEHPDFQAWFTKMAPSGRMSSKTAFASPQIQLSAKALITGASPDSAGALVIPDQYRTIVPAGRQELTFRDVVTVIPTSSDTIEYVKVVDEDIQAAPVPEAGDIDDDDALKPQSNFTLERVSDSVKTVAHWIAVTTRALQDAPQLRALIDNFLMYGLDLELENQMVAGDGSDENFTGLEHLSDTGVQAWDTDIFTTMRKAKTKVRLEGRARANAYLLHPNDAERLDLEKDGEDRFMGGGPFMPMNLNVWRLPVVECEAVTEGTGWCGDFRQCVLWDRGQATIQASNSHADFFIRNLVAILAELRAGFGCLKPPALIQMDLTA